MPPDRSDIGLVALFYLAAALVLSQAGLLVTWAIGWRPRDPGGIYTGSEEHRRARASVDDGMAFDLGYWRTMSTAEQAEFDEQQLAFNDAEVESEG
ncbi:hypothetical protein [Streptomyces sp. WMMC940]|uniref:hypothetical protein n=1 Tax=Streptomyces sp. WMMC940 TaxID=3015153 RepID=UPI0022B728C8|nr:hypothetical protein [Streptomyces sp. WMMC940]MCZ7456194.1 hypothetical protein [Streptomyces sp. WMMC940]